MKKINFSKVASCRARLDGGATVLPHQWQWRGKGFYVKIVVRQGRSCRADTCDAAACFGHATDFGVAKSVRFENKKSNGVIFGIYFKKG